MPDLYIIAGPNGAGKTSLAYTLLPDFLKISEFVNADEIARGLSPFNIEGAKIQEGTRSMEKTVKTKKVTNQLFKLVDRAIRQSSDRAAILYKKNKLPLIVEPKTQQKKTKD
jgi:tRNA A37 N6-isopentenylltransferase MiaA